LFALDGRPSNRSEEMGMTMKKFVLAVVAAVMGTSATAGGLAEPAMEPEVVEQAAGTSTAGIIIPILLLLLIAAAVAGGDSGE
jgi:hypothetical protein